MAYNLFITSFYVFAIINEAPWDIFAHGFMFAGLYYLFQFWQFEIICIPVWYTLSFIPIFLTTLVVVHFTRVSQKKIKYLNEGHGVVWGDIVLKDG